MSSSASTKVRFSFRQRLPGELGAVEALSLSLREELATACSPADAFAGELLFREAAANAVFHGCRCPHPEDIEAALRVYPDRLFVAIQDPGDGFDWRTVLTRTCDDLSPGGRGIAIYRRLAHRMHFNDKGNAIALTRFFNNVNHNGNR